MEKKNEKREKTKEKIRKKWWEDKKNEMKKDMMWR